MFEDVLVGDLDTVLTNIRDDLTIPLEENYNMIYDHEKPIVTYPIIFTKNPTSFWAESDFYKRNMCFLIYLCSIIDPLEEDWLEQYFMEEDILQDITLRDVIEDLWEAFSVDY